jgi:hypothetical protein
MAKAPGRQGTSPERPEIASRSELNTLLAKLARRHPIVEGEDETERYAAIRSSLEKIDQQKLQALARRAFTDIWKSPGQKLGTARPPSGDKPPAPRAKPADKSKDGPTSNAGQAVNKVDRWRD